MGRYPKPRRFYPKNGDKYIGTYPIICRSSLEAKMFRVCDNSSKVLKWASESIVIKYLYPLDGRIHKYYPDIFLEVDNNQEKELFLLIEIKPQKKVIPPKRGRKHKKTFIREAKDFIKNQAKWKAAKKWCNEQSNKNRKIEFRLCTEENLGI